MYSDTGNPVSWSIGLTGLSREAAYYAIIQLFLPIMK